MKKILASVLVALGLTVFLPAMTLAAPTTTFVGGHVQTASKTAVAGADVTVTCNGKTMTDTTDTNGDYGVAFSATDCPAGTKVTVAASKGKLNGANSGNAVAHNSINVVILPVTLISTPEFGLAATFGAAGIAGAGFLVMRRRSAGANA